jgi:Holliday junction resolvase RusA-like endonuclease
MRIELGHLPDSNLNPNRFKNRFQLASAKKQAKEDSFALVMSQGKPDRPFQKAHITITWVAKDKRRRDTDNLLASMKAYIDGLVIAGLLVDDSADHVSYTLQYERGTANNTIIEVREIGE